MPLTRPIPPEAMPVVLAIRKEVPRPKELPTVRFPLAALGSDRTALRWDWKWGEACPLGLHNKSGERVPTSTVSAPWLSGVAVDGEIFAFIKWWDAQADPAAAVDAVWGRA